MNSNKEKSGPTRVEEPARQGEKTGPKRAGGPEQLEKMKKPLYAALAVLVVADFFIHREHASLIWESIPGFNALYGLIATVLIIVVSKFLGHAWLMKPENYYD